MTKSAYVPPTLHFIVVKAKSGEMDAYLRGERIIDFHPGDTIVADVPILLTPGEQESLALAAWESENGFDDSSVLLAIAEKIFLEAYKAGAGIKSEK